MLGNKYTDVNDRFRVDLLGLVLRVLVTSASVPERAGAKKVLKRVHNMGGDSFGELRLTHQSPTYDLDGWRISWGRLYAMGDGYVPLDCWDSTQTPRKEGFRDSTNRIAKNYKVRCYYPNAIKGEWWTNTYQWEFPSLNNNYGCNTSRRKITFIMSQLQEFWESVSSDWSQVLTTLA